jgi:hypothetical protein
MADYRLPVEGGCLCGAVRFVADRAPLQGAFCHCKAYRKSYGGLFQATVQFAAEGFRFSRGEARYYRSSPSARRGFCETCGCPFVFRYDGIADLWVLIGAPDRPEDARRHMGAGRALPCGPPRTVVINAATSASFRGSVSPIL